MRPLRGRRRRGHAIGIVSVMGPPPPTAASVQIPQQMQSGPVADAALLQGVCVHERCTIVGAWLALAEVSLVPARFYSCEATEGREGADARGSLVIGNGGRWRDCVATCD